MPLKKLFSSDSRDSNQASSKTNQLAVAVLLFRLVRSDGKAKMLELVHMSELLRKEFSLTQEELELTIKKASEEEAKGISSDEFIAVARENLSCQKRIKLLEFLWVIAFSDDQIEKQEVDLIRSVAKRLELTEIEQVTAQENAEKHLGLDIF